MEKLIEAEDQVPGGNVDNETSLPLSMVVAAGYAREGGDQFVKPGALVAIRLAKGQSLSLASARLLSLMIIVAGGNAWDDVRHRIRKADIRRSHKSNERIGDMLKELHQTLFVEDEKSWRDEPATKRFGLIEAWEEVDARGKNTGYIEWQFTPDARRLIQKSDNYAVMHRQAVLSFRSAYALRLYEEGALRVRRRNPTWMIDINSLRGALGIGLDKYSDFAQLRRKVLTVAKREIDEFAHFKMDWQEFRRGRAVTRIKLRFSRKDVPAQVATSNELTRHDEVEEIVTVKGGLPQSKAGASEAVACLIRKAIAPFPSARRSSNPLSGPWTRFPQGKLDFGPTEQAARQIGIQHGGGWDVDMIAEEYRRFLGNSLNTLTGIKLENSWRGFCKRYSALRGSPLKD